ncbi:MAG: PspC domain-containing protein [bacterium]|nr:PspC domain-containing protein [bacterium]
MDRKFRRITDGGHTNWFGGVCAGLAYYLGMPTWIVRLVWAILIFGAGTGLFLYILLCIFVPKWDGVPKNFAEITGD